MLYSQTCLGFVVMEILKVFCRMLQPNGSTHSFLLYRRGPVTNIFQNVKAHQRFELTRVGVNDDCIFFLG